MKTLALFVSTIMITQFSAAQLPDFTLGLHDGGPAFDQGNGIASDKMGSIITTGSFVDSATIGDSAFTSLGGPDGFLAKYDSDGGFLWAKQLGSSGSVLPNGVTTDGFDNIIVVGDFRETIDLGDTTLTSAGDFDVFLAKYDKEGTLLWARRMGGTAGGDNGLEVAADDAGNVAVTGLYWISAAFGDTTLTSVGLSEDIFVAKYTASGQFLWAASAGGPGFVDEGHSVAIHTDGSVIISGRFNQPEATFGDTTVTGRGGFIAKYDSDGRFVWVRPAVSTGVRATITDIGIGDDGSVYGVGYFPDTVVIGSTTLVSGGGNDTFVLRLDEDGALLYVNQISGSDPVFGLTLSMGASSEFFTVAGYFSGTIEFGDTSLSLLSSQTGGFMAAYTLGGFVSWAVRASEQAGFNVIRDSDSQGNGALLFVGVFRSNMAFRDTTFFTRGVEDVFVSRLNTDGTVGVETTSQIPEAYSLSQNYPNPFNPSTTIEFSLPATAIVSVKVFNTLGEEVAVLVSQELSAGSYRYQWDAALQSSGVYFYQIRAGSFKATKRMVLVK